MLYLTAKCIIIAASDTQKIMSLKNPVLAVGTLHVVLSHLAKIFYSSRNADV